MMPIIILFNFRSFNVNILLLCTLLDKLPFFSMEGGGDKMLVALYMCA